MYLKTIKSKIIFTLLMFFYNSVADEVRKLAERTQKSLGEIGSNVNLITQNVNGKYRNSFKN